MRAANPCGSYVVLGPLRHSAYSVVALLRKAARAYRECPRSTGGSAIVLDFGAGEVGWTVRATVFRCTCTSAGPHEDEQFVEEVGPIGADLIGPRGGCVGLALPRGERGGSGRLARRLAYMLEQDRSTLVERICSVVIAEPPAGGGSPNATIAYGGR